MTKRKALNEIAKTYNEHTSQIFIDALFEKADEAFLYGAWEAKQFAEYAKQFGINRTTYRIEDGVYGIKELA